MNLRFKEKYSSRSIKISIKPTRKTGRRCASGKIYPFKLRRRRWRGLAPYSSSNHPKTFSLLLTSVWLINGRQVGDQIFFFLHNVKT